MTITPLSGEKHHPELRGRGTVVLPSFWMVQREECIPVTVIDGMVSHSLGGNLISEHVEPGLLLTLIFRTK